MPFLDNVGKAAGLLSTGSPMLDIGLGLLAQSGPVAGPAPSLGQAFAGASQFAQQREQGRLRTSAMREALNERTRRNEAMGQLQGLLSGTTKVPAGDMLSPTGQSAGYRNVPTISTPQGQEQMLGLLGQIAPEAMAQGLLSQMFAQNEPPRLSTQLNDLLYLHPDMSRDEVAQLYSTNDPEKAAQLELLRINLLNAQNQREQDLAERELANLSAGIHGDKMLSTILAMDEANQVLKDSPLMTGTSITQLARAVAGGGTALANLFGADNASTQEVQRLVDAYDILQRNSNDLVAQIASAPDSGFSSAVASGLRAITAGKGGTELSYGANQQFIESNLDELLRTFEASGVPISPEIMQRARDRLNQLRGGDYSSLSDSDLLSIDPADLSAQERAALEAEYDVRGI